MTDLVDDLRRLQETIATTPYTPHPTTISPAQARYVRDILGLAPETTITWDHLMALDAVRRG